MLQRTPTTWRGRCVGLLVVLMVLASASGDVAGSCPCTCTPKYAEGSYALASSLCWGDVGVTCAGYGTNAGSYANRWDETHGEIYAAVVAVDGGLGSETSHRNCEAKQRWRRLYTWSGAQADAPGALYTGHMSGSGRITASATLSASTWDDCTSSGSGDSTAASAIDGSACQGSDNLGNVTAGLQGASASADIDTSAAWNAGVQYGETKGVTLGGSGSASGKAVANVDRNWTLERSSELCIAAGATEISAVAFAHATGVADAYADAWLFGLCDSQAFCYANSNITASLTNLRRCDR